MQKAISAADANRKFSEVLREVREGHSYIVTSHGKPVAKISPPDQGAVSERAREAFFRRLESQPIRKIGRWTREELYERD
ncbi:MAG TPA: type II toxin-antitoxin system prevent-host-death family antitoxin [Terriglobales bacterium]|nr:MAG: type II toxin-antitoxin system prevent-host-death family antitoxin [Acidobacteriota bacterium]HEV2731095.1 type II toxin-antitoxin system prevent-host-death family antitoxin [Terriglobales bacterium]